MSKYSMKKMKDKNEKYKIKLDRIFNVTFRLILCGKSELSGKTNVIGNLLLRDVYYKNIFDGENIYVVSPSIKDDDKWKTIVEQKDIPSQNIFNQYNEHELEEWYNRITENYNEAIENKEKPDPVLIIFDDCSYGGDLKSSIYGILSKIFCNGRHVMISSIVTCQKYTDCLTTARENCTGGMFFDCGDNQLESICKDFNRLGSKKKFFKMFREATFEPYSFLVINFSNHAKERYLNKDFEVINF